MIAKPQKSDQLFSRVVYRTVSHTVNCVNIDGVRCEGDGPRKDPRTHTLGLHAYLV